MSNGLTEPEYVRESRFIKGLQNPALIGWLQLEHQSGRLVVLEDEEYLKRFPDPVPEIKKDDEPPRMFDDIDVRNAIVQNRTELRRVMGQSSNPGENLHIILAHPDSQSRSIMYTTSFNHAEYLIMQYEMDEGMK